MKNTDISDAGKTIRTRRNNQHLSDELTSYLQTSTKEERGCVVKLLDSIAADYLARMPDLNQAGKESACSAVRQLQKLAEAIENNNCKASVLIV